MKNATLFLLLRTTLALLLLLRTPCSAQPTLTLMSLRNIGGNQDEIPFAGYRLNDGTILTSYETAATHSGAPIDSFCDLEGARMIFSKSNGAHSATLQNFCLGNLADSFNLYSYPLPTGQIVGGDFEVGGYFIHKLDLAGNIVWQHEYSRGRGSYLRDMIQTTNGDYVMVGESYYADTNVAVHYGALMDGDIWVLGVDSLGNKKFSLVLGGSNEDMNPSLAQAPDGGCYVLATALSTDHDCIDNHGSYDGLLAKIDKNGNVLWYKCLGGSGKDFTSTYGKEIIPNGTGGVYVLMSTSSSDGDVSGTPNETDFWVTEIDGAGNKLWDNNFDAGTDYAFSICKSTDNSLWFCGWKGENAHDAEIFHISNTGTLLGTLSLGSNGMDEARIIVPLDFGFVLVEGIFKRTNGSFSGLPFYGGIDAFSAIIAPWNVNVDQTTKDKQDGIKIYPNPASKRIKIALNKSLLGGHLRIINSSGIVVYEETPSNTNISVDVSEWPSGTYIAILQPNNQPPTHQTFFITN